MADDAGGVTVSDRGLREVAADPLFLRGLAQASTPLYTDVSRWLADPSARLRRRTLVGLANYISRATAKTSPFSTFTSIAFGSWRPDGAPVDIPRPIDVRPVVEIDRLVLSRLTEQAIDRSGLRERQSVRVNPGLVRADGALVLPGRGVHEPIVRLPDRPEVALCLNEADRDPAPTRARLVDRLRARTGAAEDQLSSFVDGLLRIGALQHDDPIPDQTTRPLADLAAWLRPDADTPADRTATPTMPATSARLAELGDTLRTPAEPADVAGHLRHQERIVAQTRALADALALGWGDEVSARKVAHESMVSLAPAGFSAGSWRPCLDDLDALRRWLALHDRMLPVRLALDGYLATRFADRPTVPLVLLHEAVQRDLAAARPPTDPRLVQFLELLRLSGPVAAAALTDGPDERLRTLAELRATSVQTLLSSAGGEHHLVVAPDVLRGLAASWPDWVTPPDSLSCYVQPHLSDATLRLVVNVVSGGHGRGSSRWLRLRQLAGGPAAQRRDPAETVTGPLVAELSGTYGASVNLRAPGAPYEIHYPYTTSSRPDGERIRLGDLAVRRASGGLPELFRTGDGRAVQPAHLGLMADPLLPPTARFMMACFGRSFFMHPNFPLLTLPETAAGPGGVSRAPRLDVGSLTIQRARWRVAAAEVPARAPAEGFRSHLLRLGGWLRDAGIPRRCYVRFAADTSDWRDHLLTKSRKPMYVDFANELLVAAFDHALRGCSGELTFEEELPVATELTWPDAGEPRVTEVIVEVNGDRS